jgi:FkbM family methyltransferase
MSSIEIRARLVLGMTLRQVGRVYRRESYRLLLRDHLRKWCTSDELEILTRAGFRMKVSPRDYMSYGVYFFGEYDAAMTSFIKSHVVEGDVCWDVGAERGWFSLLLGRLVGPTGQVDAFEAFPQNFKKLTSNIDLNGYGWVRPVHAAVSSSRHPMWFVPPSDEVTNHVHYLDDCSGVGYLSAEPLANALEVQTVTLDEHAAETGTDRLSFVKLDVEGAELDALQGAEKTICRYHPRLAVEYNRQTARRAGTSIEELDQLLDDFGYDRFTFAGRLERLRLERWAEVPDEQAVCNVYCLPRRMA